MASYAAVMSLSESTYLLRRIIHQSSTTAAAKLLLPQLENKIQSLRKKIHFLLFGLEKSPAYSQLEAQIKDAADESEGIIRRFVSELLHSKLAVDDVLLKSLCHQLDGMHEDVSFLRQNVDFSVHGMDTWIDIRSSSSPSRQIPLTRKQDIIGLGDVFEELSRFVFEESSTELGAVSIVGVGGIGKTTLARRLYNNITTLEVFKIRGWVTVSQDFGARDILVSLMASIQPLVRHPKQRNESIENHVRKNLKGRRFLIVLDDVWSEEALHFLVRTFPDDGNSSRILVTTRKKRVSVKANTKIPMHIVMMRLMNPDESYRLLLCKVFPEGRDRLSSRDILKRIAEECEGLPLAIVLVAGILFTKQSRHEWEYVCSKIISASKSGHEKVDFILSLSYTLLPHHLRSCLLYVGAFPEDHEINVSRLTKQLLAQDFLQKSPRFEVKECLEDLVRRNLVSVVKWKSDNRIKSICLHDMVRDFFLIKAQEEKFLHCVTNNDSSHRNLTGRRIKVMFNSDNLRRSCISDNADKTRTIMCFGRGRTRSPLTSIGRFRLLQSLYLVNVLEIESFPMEVLQLFLLRLLCLDHVPELPPSISNLQDLETLMINPRDASPSSMTLNLPRILCLPFEIWTMPCLRHIISFCCCPLPSPNQETSPLKDLETLNAVMNLDCSNELMEMIPNIEKLVIFYFGVERAMHSIRNIERLRNLEKLKLWVLVPFSSPQNLDLGFPRTLRKLTLRGIQLSCRDMNIIGQLPNLQVLKLSRNDFDSDEWRIREGFWNLKYLLLEELGLRHWLSNRGESSILPTLQKLIIRTCNQLNEIPKFVENVRTLELIEVVGCKNKSLVESARRIKQLNVQKPKLEVLIKNYG